MGQQAVLDFLKKNGGSFLSCREVSKILSINHQSANASLGKLAKAGFIEMKIVSHKQGQPKRLYSYVSKDDHFEEALSEYQTLKAQSRFSMVPSAVVTNIMIIAELKKLGEMKR